MEDRKKDIAKCKRQGLSFSDDKEELLSQLEDDDNDSDGDDDGETEDGEPDWDALARDEEDAGREQLSPVAAGTDIPSSS